MLKSRFAGCVLGVSLLLFPSSSLYAVDRLLLAQTSSGPTRSKPIVALDSEGLRLVTSSTGSTRALGFGMKEADLIAILTQLRGKPRARGINRECGAGPLTFATWADGLTLWFAKGRFAGWNVDGRQQGARQLTTIAGVGIGLPRTQLASVYNIKVSESSLGTEFSAGNLGGLLSGKQASARITNLWGGTTCLFR